MNSILADRNLFYLVNNPILKSAVLMFTLVILVGCSSLKSRNVLHQGGPYPGVRNLGENYSETDWGAVRVPAMIIDLPFSVAADTLALPFDAVK